MTDQVTEVLEAFKAQAKAASDFRKDVSDRMDELEGLITRPSAGGSVRESEQDREVKAAMLAYARRGGDGISPDIKAQLSVNSDPSGGFFVHPDLSGRIVSKIFETSPIRTVASIVNTDSDALEGVNDLAEAGAGWIGETADRTETTTPDVGAWRIPVHEMFAEPRATQKILDDADRNVEDWLINKLSMKFSRLENTAFVKGDGVGKPRGFLTYPTSTDDDDSRDWETVQHVVSGASGAFAGNDPADALLTLVFKLKPTYLPNATWLMARSTMAEVAKLKDGDGRYLLTAGGGIQNRTPFSLIGFPVLLAEDMPALAANSLSIAFGDFGGYQIVDRLGVSLLRDPYTKKGFVKFYSRKRVGADLLDFDSIKLMKFSA